MKREINGKEYTFRMTRAGVRAAERAGMNMSEIGDKPVAAMYYLWYAALHQEHPMPLKKSDDLLDAYLDDETCPEGFDDLIASLMEDYTEVFGIATE